MNLREYQHILMIAQERNITRAAERLYISQPALSKMLASVEKEMGTALFDRRGRSLALTPAGKIFVHYAGSMLRLQSQMTNKIQHEIRKQSGPYLHIGVIMLHMEFFLGTVVPAFHRQCPNAFVNLEIAGSGQAVERLGRGDYSLCLCVLPDEKRTQVESHSVGEQEYVLVVPGTHPLRSKARTLPGYTYPCIDADNIADSNYLMINPRSRSGQWAEAYFEKHNIAPHCVTEVMSPAVAYRAVAQGNGVCILPSLPPMVHGLGDQIAYLSLDGNTQVDTLVLIHEKHRSLTEQEVHMVEIIRACYQGQIV